MSDLTNTPRRRKGPEDTDRDKLAKLGERVLETVRRDPHLLNSELPHAETRAEMFYRFMEIRGAARGLGLLDQEGAPRP